MEILASRVGTLESELGCRQYRCQVTILFFITSKPPFLSFSSFSFSDALRLNSNSPDALSLRGLVLFLSGRLPQALQHATSALRLDPGHEPAQRLRKRVKDVERLKEEGNSAPRSGTRCFGEIHRVPGRALLSLPWHFFCSANASQIIAYRRIRRGRKRWSDQGDLAV